MENAHTHTHTHTHRPHMHPHTHECVRAHAHTHTHTGSQFQTKHGLNIYSLISFLQIVLVDVCIFFVTQWKKCVPQSVFNNQLDQALTVRETAAGTGKTWKSYFKKKKKKKKSIPLLLRPPPPPPHTHTSKTITLLTYRSCGSNCSSSSSSINLILASRLLQERFLKHVQQPFLFGVLQ